DQGIELIDESEAEEREGTSGPLIDDEARAELDLSFMEEEDSRRIDDPVRMYLTQMGEIPLLKREQEIALAKKIEVTRKRFRRKAVTLVEELSIRTQKVQPLMKKLEQMSAQMDELEQKVEELKGNRAAKEDRANLEKELHDYMMLTLEETGSLRKRVEIVRK